MFSTPNFWFGFIFGAFVGVMVYLLMCWREDRRKRRSKQPGILQPTRRWPRH